ncbi:MAG: isopeptide-forming domain-containing fimbrial protein, partial [Caldilineae bacterium]
IRWILACAFALAAVGLSQAPLGVLAQSSGPTPVVTLNAPATQFIGEDFSFTVTFDNASPTDVGYGPFVDVVFPVNGADGAAGTDTADGIDFLSATYLGSPVTSTQLTFPDADGTGPGTTGCVTHPYAVDNTGTPLQVCGTAGDKLVVLQLPFGSFTNDQPPAAITVNASLSNLADLSTPLTLAARAGFQYGADALDNPSTDPSILSDSSTDSSTWTTTSQLTPVLMTLTKIYHGPEDETATGPNFPRQYTIQVDIADGQTVTNLDVFDDLPNNLAYLKVVSTSPAASAIVSPTVGAPANPPNNQLKVTFASVTGGAGSADATVTFEYFVPQYDAGGAYVLNPETGDDVKSENQARAVGDWDPVDSRDPSGTDNAVADPSGVEHTLWDKSIAIQKSVAVAVDTGAAGATPGDTLEYTLDFQVSDFFAFRSVVITDTFSDGQRWDATFTPTLSFNGNTYVLTSQAITTTNYTVDESQIGNDPDPATDGSTTVIFRVSDELITRGRNGKLVGGCVPPTGTGGGDPDCDVYDDGGTTGQIKFRTVIQQNFSDTYPSGDSSVDQGDVLNNAVLINGNLLNVSDLTPKSTWEDDDSSAGVQIARGALTKSVYAINGSTSFSTNPIQVAPGDQVTYRFTYTLISSDIEDLKFVDYPPLPIFNATTVTSFDPTVSAAAPPSGQAKFGPDDTFFAISGITPALSSDATANSLTFNFGDFDDPQDRPSKVDILFTVTVSDDPFADGLFLTNQVRETEGSTNSGAQALDAIVMIQLTEPVLSIKKGVVATDGNGAVFSPTQVGPSTATFNPPGSSPAWTGTISSTNLSAAPINSNLSGVDADDLVTFAIVLENTGMGLRGAFDVTISDTLPAGFTTPPGGLNLQARDGTGASLTYTDLGGGLFGAGIRLDDPGPNTGSIASYDANNGKNIVIITYDLQVAASAAPGQVLTNTATLFNYAGAEGGPDHTLTDKTDTATVTLVSPQINKWLAGTNQSFTSGTNVAIGEIITYTTVITVPEGTSSSVTLVDTLDKGLAFVDLVSLTASPALSTSKGTFNDVLTGASITNQGSGTANQGRKLTLDFGTVTNSSTDDSDDEQITLVYRAVVINGGSNDRGDRRNNSAVWSWNGNTISAAATNATIVEPTLVLSKAASPTTGDAGDEITFDLAVSHDGASNADAFNVVLTDTIPAGMTFVTDSLTHTVGLTPTSMVQSGGLITVTWDSLP